MDIGQDLSLGVRFLNSVTISKGFDPAFSARV
jgi:hypothetical protein